MAVQVANTDVSLECHLHNETSHECQDDEEGLKRHGGFCCKMLNAVSVAPSKREDEDLELLVLGHLDKRDDQFAEGDFQQPPCEAGGIAEPRRHLGNPTKVEIEEHNLTHCPYRSWCPVRVESQGEEDPHYRATSIDIVNEAPVVSMDYKELSEHEQGKAEVTVTMCREK